MKHNFLQLTSLLMFAHVHAGDTTPLHRSSCATSTAFTTSPSQLASRKHNPACPKISSSSSSLSKILDGGPVDIESLHSLIHDTDNTALVLLRDELKSRLLKATDDFRSMKVREGAIARNMDTNDGGYVYRLLVRIVRKIASFKKKTSEVENKPTTSSSSQGILNSASFSQMKLEVGAAGKKVIKIAEQLSLLNPTAIPTLGFKSYGGAPPAQSKLGGNWKLRFTTAADASFSESAKRGVATTSQVIDAKEGTFTNVVDFEKGTLKGFRVVVEGEPTSATDIGLSFTGVKILRDSRFRLFREFSIRLPSMLIRWLASRNTGPYLRLRYLDDDFRMHVTDADNWFIQTRL